MSNEFKNKTILVTGGTGSIGSEIVVQLLKFKPKHVRIFSRNDTRQYELMEKLSHPKNVRLFIGDVRDRDRLDLAMQNVDIVFHAAALKHVPLCEYNPFEAIKTNVVGSQNVIDMALKHNVKKIIGISTDKAANPNNVMGITKLLMERLFVTTNFFAKGRTVLACVRFGNVAWAQGSVLPIWHKQAESGRITLTHDSMTRFFMSIPQAVRLTLRAAELSRGAETFIFKMPSASLGDLAKMFLEKYHLNKKVRIDLVGNRPGEKIHEDLVSTHESYAAILADKEMFILIPKASQHVYGFTPSLSGYKGFKKIELATNYSSEHTIDLKKIRGII